MKAIKPARALIVVVAFFSGCAVSPDVPELTSNHPASVQALAGKVAIPTISLMGPSILEDIPSAKPYESHRGTGHAAHDMNVMKEMGGMSGAHGTMKMEKE